MSPAPKFPKLAEPVSLGALNLEHRVIMSSLTRNRSIPTTVPNADNVLYYTQRASPSTGASLILSEGTLISHQGTEWPHAPGIWDEEHAQAWRKITDAVHAQGGLIVCQLWHTGRVCRYDAEEQQKGGEKVWGPSAVAARGGKFHELPGMPGYITPEPIPDPTVILDQYSNAAKMAKLAGFDGVELHAANGYLVEQFLSDVANVREDKWGGSVENRIRFGVEAAKRLVEVWGADRVGVKITPTGGYNDSYNTTAQSRVDTISAFVSALDSLSLAYIQLVTVNFGDPHHDGVPQGYNHDVLATYGPLVKKSKIVVNGGWEADSAEEVVKAGKGVEAVVFGQKFLANPDFYKRFQEGLGLNETHIQTWFTSAGNANSVGYTDYPLAE
ncbi:hypothetical protein IAT38_002676 [Cryptococcus sp. DSM 104549]